MGAAAAVVALGSTFTSAVLALREPDPPAVLRVNSVTGAVDVVQRLNGGDTNYDEVSNKYWTELYVRNREGYSRQLAEDYVTRRGADDTENFKDYAEERASRGGPPPP